MNMVVERWERYIRETEQFALYPEAGTGSNMALAYAALGLVDEWQECDDARWLLLQDGSSLMDKLAQNFRAELGDLLWYTAANQRELEARAPGCISGYAYELEDSGFWRSVTSGTHAYAGRIKKLLRGDDAEHLIRQAAEYLRDVRDCLLSYESAVAAMDYNVKKLSSRLERGVIRGDGDNR